MRAPYLSVVVELDNWRHGEAPRARVMLDRLFGQVREMPELHGRVEIVLIYDARGIPAVEVDAVVADLYRRDDPFSVETIPTDGLTYYQLKNEGARRTRGEILLFADSDVLPEETWLRRLLESFRDPRVEIVAGNTYVDRDTFYAKTFHLGWYFPPRLADGPLFEAPPPFVNTVAMRRHMFDKYPFPDDPALYMAQTIVWVLLLKNAGVTTYVNPSARVAHPPPVFLRSALLNGYDVAHRERRPGESKLESVRRSYWGWREDMRDMSRRIRGGYREVAIAPWAVPLSLVVAGTYWTIYHVAELLARWSPRLIPHSYLK